MDYTRLNRQIAMRKWTDKPHDFGTPLSRFGQQMINMEFGSTLYFQILSFAMFCNDFGASGVHMSTLYSLNQRNPLTIWESNIAC